MVVSLFLQLHFGACTDSYLASTVQHEAKAAGTGLPAWSIA